MIINILKFLNNITNCIEERLHSKNNNFLEKFYKFKKKGIFTDLLLNFYYLKSIISLKLNK